MSNRKSAAAAAAAAMSQVFKREHSVNARKIWPQPQKKSG